MDFFHFAFLVGLWHFRNKKSIPPLYLAYVGLALPCLSLLTNLVLFPIYTLVLWALCYPDPTTKHLRIHLFLAPLISGTLTLALVAKPIFYLLENNEFEFGVASIWDSVKSFVVRTFNFLPSQDFVWLNDILTIIFLVAIAYVLFTSLKLKKNKFFSISFIVLLIVLHILCFGFGIMFPHERKTTLYLPILALLFSNYLYGFQFQDSKKLFFNSAALVACFLILLSNKLFLCCGL